MPALVVPLQEVGADGFPIGALLDLERRAYKARAADFLIDRNAALSLLARRTVRARKELNVEHVRL